jgi:hypothetical protein
VQPVFVLHGVGNRDQQGFEADVLRLQRAAGPGWDLRPVFWGDLGADDDFVDLTIPRAAPDDGLREGGTSSEPDLSTLVEALLAGPVPDARGLRDGAARSLQLEAVNRGVRRRLGGPSGLRDSGGDERLAQQVQAAIKEEWPHTQWLRRTQDADLLEQTGAAVAAAVRDQRGAGVPGGEALRGVDVGAFVRQRLRDLDAVVGAAVGAVAGRLDTWARDAAGPGVARFFGDVLVYQRRRADIQARVREAMCDAGVQLGDQGRPVQLLAHSLGGVVALDMATADDPLWISRLVTFGSQFPLFHAIDPRQGLLAPLTEGVPATLPPSVATWTNLWEPMDLLAFVAGRVFRLHDGSTPQDVRVPHLASSGLWTHSAYWQQQALTATMSRVFG